jgi:hypothetical protein
MQSRKTKAQKRDADDLRKPRHNSMPVFDRDGAPCGCMNPDKPSTEGNSVDEKNTSRGRLIRALANPLEVRLDVELIRDLGVSEKQAKAWMDEPEFQAAVEEELGRRCGEARAAVWRALIREALRGSFQHIKLYLELTGDLRPRVDEPEGMGTPVVIIRPDQNSSANPSSPWKL